MTKLAHLISKEEGYGLPGAVPTLRNNPGDLRHSPHSQHPGGLSHKEDIGTIDTKEHGEQDLDRQLQLFADRGLTLRQAIQTFAPPSENDTGRYLRDMASGLGVSPDTPMVEVLKIQA